MMITASLELDPGTASFINGMLEKSSENSSLHGLSVFEEVMVRASVLSLLQEDTSESDFQCIASIASDLKACTAPSVSKLKSDYKHNKYKSAKSQTHLVDPATGERSSAPDAISYSAFMQRRRVDPATGESSSAPDAISYSAFQKRRRVDPATGERSSAPDAISYNAFMQRRYKLRRANGLS